MNSPMLKNILAAIVGYVVMFAAVFITFSIMWLILGPGGSFEPGSWAVSTAWVGASIVLGLLAGIAGGFVCSKLAASHQGVAILIGLVLVLGIASAIPDAPVTVGPRPDDISMFDAMLTANQPRWLAWLTPVLGVVGTILGSRLQAKKAA